MKLARILVIILFLSHSAFSQTEITITISTAKDGTVTIKNGANELRDLEGIDFSDGKGKLHIVNQTTENVIIGFIDGKNNLVFRIPAEKISANGNTDFTIDKDGKLNPIVPAGQIVANMGVSMKTKELSSDKIILKPQQKEDSKKKKIVKGINDNKLYSYVQKQIDKEGYIYVPSQNIIVDKNGVIHIYLDENGTPIYSYYPVTGKENMDKFQFHIIATNSAGYVVESDAEFNPIEISSELKTNVPSAQSDLSGQPVKYSEYKSPIFGPYSNSFPFTITKTVNGSSDIIVDRTIKLLKTSRISLGTAVVATWLKEPGDIATFVKPNGDTTLIADDKNTRGFLSIFLTFHFIPRNLNIQPRRFGERLGISVGSNLSDRTFTNFFVGLNVEVTNGLFVNLGGHYGRVNYVVGHDKFDFGNEVFSGNLVTKKKWQLGGPYIAVNIDAALFAKVFQNILGTTPK